jgi:cytoskeletal protein CcmA (bactofilin family)
MFRKNTNPGPTPSAPVERVTSVLGPGISWEGNLRGSGGVRIEGTFEGEISLRGLVVIGETGRITCTNLRANTVIVAGAVRGNVTAEKLEIRSTGRVWGDVVTGAFATEEGAFLRGQIRMEDRVELGIEEPKPDEKVEGRVPGTDNGETTLDAHQPG